MRVRQQIIIIVLLFFHSAATFSQSGHIDITPGAAAVGMGGSLVGGGSNSATIYWNAAALAFVTSKQLFLSVDAPYRINYLGASAFFPNYGTFGMAFSAPHRLNPYLSTSSVAWGYKFLNQMALGINVNFHTVGQITQSTFDLSTYYQLPDDNLFFQRFPTIKQLFQNSALSFGVNFVNLPVDNPRIRHSIRCGMYYENFGTGMVLNTAFHLQQPEPSFHLGLGARINEHYLIYVGSKDFNQQQLAGGLRYSGLNFTIDCVYWNYTQSVQISLGMVLGKNACQLAQEHILRGQKRVERGYYRQALAEYRQAICYDAQNDSIAGLIHYLEKRKSQEDRTIDSLYAEATKSQSRKNYISAAYHYSKILQIDPFSERARTNLKLIKPHVDDFIERFFDQAVLNFSQGDLKTAERMFKAILLIRENHRDVKQYLTQIADSFRTKAQIHFYRAWGFEKQKDFERAKKEYETALEYDQQSEMIQERYQSLIEQIQKNQAQMEKQVEDLLIQARRNFEQNKKVRAYRFYQRVLELAPDHHEARLGIQRTQADVIAYVKQRYRRAKNYFDNRQFIEAENVFQEVIAVATLHPDLKSYEQNANGYLRRISSIHSQECEQLYQNGLHFLQQKNWEAALESFEKMMQLKCNEKLAHEKYQETLSLIGADSLTQMGNRYFSQGNFLEAMNCFQKVIETRPEDVNALRKIEECQARLNQIVEEYFNLGMSYYAEENYQEAIRQWQRVLQYNRKHQDAQEYIKRAQERIEALKRLR